MAKTSSGVINRVSFGGGRLIYNGLSWPLRGAHATVSDKRSGLIHRKHVITLTVSSDDYPVMTWRGSAHRRSGDRSVPAVVDVRREPEPGRGRRGTGQRR